MPFQFPEHDPDEFDPMPDIEVARSFDKLLKDLDPDLRCFWVKADAESFENPGRWHIGRLHSNPDLNVYWVIANEDGSYCEPQQRHLDRLKEMDTHTRNVLEDIRRMRSTRQIEAQKRHEELRREFREKLSDRLDHLYDGRISVPSIPGSMVSQAKKGLTVIEKEPKKLVLP